MTIDRNRIKLELLNFRNYAEIYADSRNLITEYERNDNKITAAERHDIRLTKLEKNAKAKIPFKELFDRYAELKASDTNPFSTDVFALSLIERRNPLVKQAFEILGTERVRELKYNQTQIRRELIKCSADELAYKIVKRINADLPHGKAIPSKIIKGEFYQFNLSSCIRQQNSLTAQFVSFSLANLANIFYPPRFLQ